MITKVTGILAILFLISSCGSQTASDGNNSSGQESVDANISEVLTDPLEYDGKTIKIEGIISHVCRHGGDKMRVLQEGSDLSIQVMLGDFTGRFDAGSEGNRVVLTGQLVTEVTNLDQLAAHSHDENGNHDCETTREAVEVMKAMGLDANIRTYVTLNHYESQ